MNKLIHYFKEGKGRGLKIMFFFSFAVALFVWGNYYLHMKDWPKDQQLINSLNRLPTITISNGTVVAPKDVNMIYPIEISNKELATVLSWNNIVPVLYLQTDRAGIQQEFLPDGFYLTQTEFAFSALQRVQSKSKFVGDAIITPESIIQMFSWVIFLFPIVFASGFFIAFWILYLIIVAVSALLVWICRFKLNKGTVWRSASFALISIFLIDIALTLIFLYVFHSPFNFSGLLQILTCVLLVLLISFGIRKKK